jgi:hypothetical protein
VSDEPDWEDEPDWDEIQDGLVDAHDLLAAATVVQLVDPVDAVADLYRALRRLLSCQRMAAFTLRRQPPFAEKMADFLDSIADLVEQVLPPGEDEGLVDE